MPLRQEAGYERLVGIHRARRPGPTDLRRVGRYGLGFGKGAHQRSGLRRACRRCFVSAAICAVGIFALGKFEGSVVGVPLYIDRLSAVMLTLVAFIGAVVIRYSGNYLDGDPDQRRFLQWLCWTVAAVSILVIAGHFAVFVLAWIVTSLCLHRLLLFYPERPGARIAARKKFLVSRLGDIALILAGVCLYRAFGTLEFGALFTAETAAEHGATVTAASFALIVGAVMKSAQFPFHSWLPEVMETPTPVSALMHAGIINAGGFLVIRMSTSWCKPPPRCICWP
ncbi:proton-conducting transporter transmembrane domain-containing protein [Methylomonas koyamae]|uniref:proton-conducting transporter transmembrane domain-containing protein n=1 Tax=Methylomonas koyamae TaxID=702114 RepID=UPI000A79EAFA|nr:proton-conducting transporter membrane subunit [Methylomonas koyamae]